MNNLNIHIKNNIMLWIIIIFFSFFIYTFLEFFLYKKGWLDKPKHLWSSPWSFLWGAILFLLLNFILPGEYKPWGNILYVKKAIKHIIPWVLGLLVYHSFNNSDLF